MQMLLALVLGYLCGSVPFGLLLTRWAGTADIRTIGSGNIGSTNVLRTGRRDLAALTLICDTLKGTLAVVLAARYLGAGEAAAVGAFAGHVLPVWLNFRGGKGVATYLGCLIGLAPLAALAFALLWLGTAFITRFSSAAALLASAATPLLLLVYGDIRLGLLFAALAAALWVMHRENIGRLLAGTEGRIGQKS